MFRMRLSPALKEAMEVIYSHFEPYLDNPVGQIPNWLDAAPILDDLSGVASLPTIIRARKLLKVKSSKIAGKWKWSLPKNAPDEAMDIVHQRRMRVIEKEKSQRSPEQIRLDHPSVSRLSDYMREHNYEIKAKQLEREWQLSRTTLFAVKKILEIESQKRDDGWYWLYAGPGVCDWVIDKLSQGPVALKTMQAAFENMGWSRQLLSLVLRQHAEIIEQTIDGERFLLDVNVC